MKSNIISVIALVVAVVALFLVIKTQYLTSLQVQPNQGKAAGDLNYQEYTAADTAYIHAICREYCGMGTCYDNTVPNPVQPPPPGPGHFCTPSQLLCYYNCVASGGRPNRILK